MSDLNPNGRSDGPSDGAEAGEAPANGTDPAKPAKVASAEDVAKRAGRRGQRERYALESAKPLPDVTSRLPLLLRRATALFSRERERDIFLMASLPVLAGCMPNVQGLYGRWWHTPDLFTAVIAPPASGKGTARWANELGKKTDEALGKMASASSEGAVSLDPPDYRWGGLFLPGNTSYRALIDALSANGGRGTVFQTEMDTVSNALGQEWGGFGELLRAAYHHEDLSISRKGEVVRVKSPQLSLFLSGTPDQFMRLVPSSENGLYSRFGIYYSPGEVEWISQKPTEEDQVLRRTFDELASSVHEIYTALASRPEPLTFELRDSQWEVHTEQYRDRMEVLKLDGMGALASVLKRSALMVFRIAMIFAVLRSHEEGEDLSSEGLNVIRPSNEDFRSALEIGLRLADHSLRFSRKLANAPKLRGLSELMANLYGALPGRFKTSEAYAIGKELGVDSERTVRDWLNKFREEELLIHVRKGHYRKPTSPVGG